MKLKFFALAGLTCLGASALASDFSKLVEKLANDVKTDTPQAKEAAVKLIEAFKAIPAGPQRNLAASSLGLQTGKTIEQLAQLAGVAVPQSPPAVAKKKVHFADELVQAMQEEIAPEAEPVIEATPTAPAIIVHPSGDPDAYVPFAEARRAAAARRAGKENGSDFRNEINTDGSSTPKATVTHPSGNSDAYTPFAGARKNRTTAPRAHVLPQVQNNQVWQARAQNGTTEARTEMARKQAAEQAQQRTLAMQRAQEEEKRAHEQAQATHQRALEARKAQQKRDLEARRTAVAPKTQTTQAQASADAQKAIMDKQAQLAAQKAQQEKLAREAQEKKTAADAKAKADKLTAENAKAGQQAAQQQKAAQPAPATDKKPQTTSVTTPQSQEGPQTQEDARMEQLKKLQASVAQKRAAMKAMTK